jgi:hypothetical protein
MCCLMKLVRWAPSGAFGWSGKAAYTEIVVGKQPFCPSRQVSARDATDVKISAMLKPVFVAVAMLLLACSADGHAGTLYLAREWF